MFGYHEGVRDNYIILFSRNSWMENVNVHRRPSSVSVNSVNVEVKGFEHMNMAVIYFFPLEIEERNEG